MPHFSLLYGELTDEEKEKAKERAMVLDDGLLNTPSHANYLFASNVICFYQHQIYLPSFKYMISHEVDEITFNENLVSKFTNHP